MYERNAIVLERYFYEIFGFKNSRNLKVNYDNYRSLFECYDNLCEAKERERIGEEEFENISNEIVKFQKKQEELYNKGTKFEYGRYVIFNNTQESPENIEKHLQKINENVQKNNDELKELGEKFVQAIRDYSIKENNLKEAIIARENAQKEYDEVYVTAKECYCEILENKEKIKEVEEFIASDNKDNKKELQNIFEENGKNEKNPFDQDVIFNTINKSIEIYKNEMDIYLAGLDRLSKLFDEIDTNSFKTDKHSKYYKDSKAKIDFLNAEKDYLVQFLDNERMGAIYDKKSHRKIMLEACKKFNLDFEQIGKLYEIILKEIAGRSTKKLYKENYNKEYFMELENSSIEPSLDTGKMRQEAIAFVNLNYWRVEGMRVVYETFENIVTEVYGKDLSEFIVVPVVEPEVEEVVTINQEGEQVTENLEGNVEIIENNNEEVGGVEEIKSVEGTENAPSIDENIIESEAPKARNMVYYSSKIVLANAIYRSLQVREFATSNDNITIPKISRFQKQDKILAPEKISSGGLVEEQTETQNSEVIKENTEENFDLSKLDDIEAEENLIENDNEVDNLEEIEYQQNYSEEIDIENSNVEESSEITENKIEENYIEEAKIENIDESEVEYDEEDDEVELEVEDEEYDIGTDELEDEEFETKLIDEANEESILEIYYSENNELEKKEPVENVKKKTGFFHKLVGFNSKEKREA